MIFCLLNIMYFRYIRLHAGNEKGCIEHASLQFKCGLSTRYYHGEMNSRILEKCLCNKISPSLEPPQL